MGFLCRVRVIVVWECGTVSRVMSVFSASEAVAFFDASLSFFLGEFFNPDGVSGSEDL